MITYCNTICYPLPTAVRSCHTYRENNSALFSGQRTSKGLQVGGTAYTCTRVWAGVRVGRLVVQEQLIGILWFCAVFDGGKRSCETVNTGYLGACAVRQ